MTYRTLGRMIFRFEGKAMISICDIIATGIQVAIDWLVEETARGGNVPRAKAEAPNAGE